MSDSLSEGVNSHTGLEVVREMFNNPNLKLREGIKLSWLSMKSDQTELRGFDNILVVKNVPLTQRERGLLGLPVRNNPYRATFYFVDYTDSDRTSPSKQLELLISEEGEQSSQIEAGLSISDKFYISLRDECFPLFQADEKETGLIHVKSDDGKPVRVEEMPDAILKEKLAQNPEKQLAFIIAHGSGTHDQVKQFGGRIIADGFGKQNVDLAHFLYNNISLDDFAAVFDKGCAPMGYIPDNKIVASPTPIFIAQQSTQRRPIGIIAKEAQGVNVYYDGINHQYSWRNVYKYKQAMDLVYTIFGGRITDFADSTFKALRRKRR